MGDSARRHSHLPLLSRGETCRVPVSTSGKPEVKILDDLDFVISGRAVKVTVTLRPSKASLLMFKQVRVRHGSTPATYLNQTG